MNTVTTSTDKVNHLILDSTHIRKLDHMRSAVEEGDQENTYSIKPILLACNNNNNNKCDESVSTDPSTCTETMDDDAIKSSLSNSIVDKDISEKAESEEIQLQSLPQQMQQQQQQQQQSSSKRNKTVKFMKQIDVYPITHVRELSKKTKDMLWFTGEDFKCIERDGYKLINKFEKGKTIRTDSDEYHSVRGLEKLVEQNASEYISLRRETLTAVLDEQEFTKRWSPKGSMKNNMKDIERISEAIATTYQQTCTIPRIRAIERATQDYNDIVHYLMNDPKCAVDAVRLEQRKYMNEIKNKKKKKMNAKLLSLLLCTSKSTDDELIDYNSARNSTVATTKTTATTRNGNEQTKKKSILKQSSSLATV